MSRDSHIGDLAAAADRRAGAAMRGCGGGAQPGLMRDPSHWRIVNDGHLITGE